VLSLVWCVRLQWVFYILKAVHLPSSFPTLCPKDKYVSNRCFCDYIQSSCNSFSWHYPRADKTVKMGDMIVYCGRWVWVLSLVVQWPGHEADRSSATSVKLRKSEVTPLLPPPQHSQGQLYLLSPVPLPEIPFNTKLIQIDHMYIVMVVKCTHPIHVNIIAG